MLSSITSQKRNAFTLVELLITVAIIGVLASMLLPIASKMMQSGKQVQCANNLRQIGMMTRNYLNDHEGKFPQMWSWMTELADYSPETTPAFHCPCDVMPRPDVPKNRWRSYGINPLIHNFQGGCPAYPGAEINTPININRIFLPSKVFYLAETFQIDSNVYSLDNPYGSITGNPGNDGKHHGKYTNLLLLDGHVESIEYRDQDWSEFANAYIFNREL